MPSSFSKCLLLIKSGLLLILIFLTACTPVEPVPPTAIAAETATTVPSPTSTPTLTPTRPVTSTPAPSPTPAPPKTEITVWENLPAPQTEQLIRDIELFQQTYPFYTVQLQHYDAPEQFMTLLAADALAFDVVLASPVLLGSLQATERLAPVSDYFPVSFVDGFASTPLQGAARAGKIWGLPDTAGFHLLLFYNPALVDAPPATTADLLALADTLSNSPQTKAKWGLTLNSYDPLWVLPWLTAYDGWLFDLDGNLTLNADALASALALHQSWHQAATSPATHTEMQSRFLRGDAAMMIDGEWAIAELSQDNQIEWAAAPLPAARINGHDSLAAPLVLARYWAISQTATGNKALAVAAFGEYITRPERQLAWVNQFGTLPTQRQALDDPTLGNTPALRASINQMQAGRMLPLGVNPNTVLNAMRPALQAMLDGDLSPAEAAETMLKEPVFKAQ